MPDFTHIDSEGRVRMVDISEKKSSFRTAVAEGKVSMDLSTLEKIKELNTKKGDVLETARIAGIMAAKKTSELIPLCHPLNVSHIDIDFFLKSVGDKGIVGIKGTVSLFGQTGVEMEALTAVSIAGLTIYDMCKAYDKGMVIGDISLLEKRGGRSGIYKKSGLEGFDSPTQKNHGPKKVKVAALVEEGLLKGWTNEKILKYVKDRIPEAKTNSRCIARYLSKWKKEGKIFPLRPKKG